MGGPLCFKRMSKKLFPIDPKANPQFTAPKAMACSSRPQRSA